MSIDTNITILGGRLTQDPMSVAGDTGVRFSVASNRYYRDSNGERVEETVYMDVTAWRGLGELVMKRCKKGSSVLVEGRLESRKVTAEDGTTKKYVNIIARDVRFVDSHIDRDEVDDEETPENLDNKSYQVFKKLVGSR